MRDLTTTGLMNYQQGQRWGGANSSIEVGLPNFGAQNIFLLLHNALKILIYTHNIVSLTLLKACPSGNARWS